MQSMSCNEGPLSWTGSSFAKTEGAAKKGGRLTRSDVSERSASSARITPPPLLPLPPSRALETRSAKAEASSQRDGVGEASG